ncbi:Os05g0594300 [Oryza sativa Japonica Group]|uniref:Os05g0594300 protein n=1 Tax=Oryza sativa subsp. japonica TaxID=39947 RepID=A0A0N7KLC8_ORYSJ|nr:hypothetical protein EE612_031502 [Oryza sativa]BAS95657.1 Os05g0594300 [Oryza sativa Japonica Group]
MTAPACSAAFPTMGSKMMLMKLTDSSHDSEAACTFTRYVQKRSQESHESQPNHGTRESQTCIDQSQTGRTCWGSNSWRCVLSWKKR